MMALSSFRRLLASACLALSFIATGIPAPGPAGASPYIHITWTKADSPHILEEPFLVDNRMRLTIEPGAEVLAGTDGALIIEGVLTAHGTEDDEIVFDSLDPEGSWPGIEIRGSGFMYESSVTGAVIRNARTAVAVGGYITMQDNTFDDNDVALDLANPFKDIAVEDNRFINNRLAISGYSREGVSISGNDLWNNETNLLPEPQPMYDCGPDAAVWTITGNDILRGPVNSEYFSNDVRTPEGSAISDYQIRATDNWWGTPIETRLQGRFEPQINCCPSPPTQEIVWSPVAVLPRTTWEPSGDVPDPDTEHPLHGDPGVVTRIDNPRHGSCRDRAEFRALRGHLGGGLGGPMEVSLALRRISGGQCRWWDHDKRKLVPGDCNDRLWFDGRVVEREEGSSSWRYRFGSELPLGKYMAWSEGLGDPSHLGRNQVAFRLR